MSVITRRTTLRFLVLAWVVFAMARPASGFILSSVDPDPWLSTASGSRPGNGAPATLTWSIVPDGTSVTSDTGFGTAPSNLIAFLNTNFGGIPAQQDLAQQPWFQLFDESFGRWEELSGVNYVYEPFDNGVLHPSQNGALGVRGDIRIGGFNIDGAGDTLAFTWLPPSGSDMVMDTGDVEFFTDETNSHRNFRDTLMHEIGHGFGLLHVNSSSALLMEPVINTSFDGPQLDEVRGAQFFFGDANEKSNGGQGNSSPALATNVGMIAGGSIAHVGADANVPGQAIDANATDFVSIANLADDDYYRFTVSQPSLLNAVLTPRGGVFTQSSGASPTPFDANARNDLALTLFDVNGTSVLANADANLAGVAESVFAVVLSAAGTYYARVAGSDDTIQLYELTLSIAALTTGDYNGDGMINAADYTVWRNSLGQSVTAGSGADGTGPFGVPDGLVDRLDYEFWKANYGQATGSGAGQLSTSIANIPEPNTLVLVFIGLATLSWRAMGGARIYRT